MKNINDFEIPNLFRYAERFMGDNWPPQSPLYWLDKAARMAVEGYDNLADAKEDALSCNRSFLHYDGYGSTIMPDVVLQAVEYLENKK